MTTQVSYLHQVLILNGTRISGFSDDDTPVELPSISLATATFGQDGTMYTSGTSMLGGDVMVRLLPTSPSVPLFLRWHAQIQQGLRIDFEGSWSDPTLGYSSLLAGGVMTECPPGISPNQNFEVTIAFESITPQFDSAGFAPVPRAA